MVNIEGGGHREKEREIERKIVKKDLKRLLQMRSGHTTKELL